MTNRMFVILFMDGKVARYPHIQVFQILIIIVVVVVRIFVLIYCSLIMDVNLPVSH